MSSSSWTAASWLLLLSAASSILFLLLLPCNLWRLHRSSIKVQPSWHGRLQAAVAVLYGALQLALLVIQLARGSPDVPSPNGAIESSLSLVASLGLLWISIWAHRRSIRPYSPVVCYLLAKLVCYSLWATVSDSSSSRTRSDRLPATAQVCLTLPLLLLECRSKRSILKKAYQEKPPETTESFLGRVLFLWINPILVEGYRKILSVDDLPALDGCLSSESLRQTILRAWDQRDKPETGATLPRALLRCLLTPFLAAVVPRTFVIMFRFAQPLLISRVIRFVTQSPTEQENLSGYWVVVGASIIYVGMALSTSVYKHRMNRLGVMIRGVLIGLLHNRALVARSDDNDDGKVVTLMSNDISNIEKSAEMLHETWAQLAEVVVGTVLLAADVGWLWPVPLVIILLCSRMSRYVAKHLKTKQGRWNMATQRRISMTGSMLGSIKNIKMLGMQQIVADHVEGLRQREMDAAKDVRWLMVAYNASANALGMFAPVLTIVLYAALAMVRGEALDVETAFTTVAILAMITHPANMVMTIVPLAVVSFSSFERIQAYLLDDGRSTQPVTMPKSFGNGTTSQDSRTTEAHSNIAVGLNGVSVAGTDSLKSTLQDINLDVLQGAVVVCTGPVGSGKTALVRAIIGDISTSHGSIQLSSMSVAYCAQTPWLPNQTIRDIICGSTANHGQDETWYHTTIQACCLDSDIKTLPDGDSTMVGSKGMNLSGGQRQRVALARAVYSRWSIFILDDSFSALDGKTQGQVVGNLLGSGGILRKLGATVLWITTATQYFHLADEIVVLADGNIKERGSWEQLQEGNPMIDEIIHPHDRAAENALENLERGQSGISRREAIIDGAKDLARKNGDLSLYGYYFKSAGLTNIFLMICCTASYAFFITVPQYWLKWWTESGATHTALYMVGYLLLLTIAWITTNVTMWLTVLRIAPTSGIVLHRRLLTAIIGAPLLYFSGTDSGSILNRFGQDIQMVDKQLALAVMALGTQTFKLLVQACLLFASQPLMSLSLPISAAVVYLVQKVYLRTSRQLRLLELESRSAIFTSFLETIQGAPTIRAFGWNRQIAQQDIHILDYSQRPFYLLLCLQRWLNVVLNLLIAGIAVGTIWLAVAYSGSTTGGQVGVALNVIIVANATLLSLVESWTGLEVSLGAVARLKEVEVDTPGENRPGECESPPENWPSQGAIEFKELTVVYSPTAIAIKNLSLKFDPGQTVVICGRTGSGKSSLLLSLLRLLDSAEGCITIDGVDITRLSRSTIRQRAFITVAQEAFFLPQASLRFNLDPNLEADPPVLVAALQRTGLWEHFAGVRDRDPDDTDDAHADLPISLPADACGTDAPGEDAEILSSTLSSLPDLSTGQSQLLALTRALVRKSVLCSPQPSTSAQYSDFATDAAKPVILLDEVTSSLDPVTERMVYDIIRDEFVMQRHTVVMVTHKLGAVRGWLRKGQDVVVWMDDGRLGTVER